MAAALPAALSSQLFYQLYESDIVFEDAYGVWREDVADDTPGKDKALFQARAHSPRAHSPRARPPATRPPAACPPPPRA